MASVVFRSKTSIIQHKDSAKQFTVFKFEPTKYKRIIDFQLFQFNPYL